MLRDMYNFPDGCFEMEDRKVEMWFNSDYRRPKVVRQVREFDNRRATACGCGTDCYSHWSVQAESIMSVIKRSDNGKSAEAYDIDELKNNWNHWVRTGEILFTPGNGRW